MSEEIMFENFTTFGPFLAKKYQKVKIWKTKKKKQTKKMSVDTVDGYKSTKCIINAVAGFR